MTSFHEYMNEYRKQMKLEKWSEREAVSTSLNGTEPAPGAGLKLWGLGF
jgi:hypothetical protein